ncbi:hypothetical protein RJ640_010209 [Escallonia rubra]|uniref:Phosphoglycolate phosphatase n=1 Tax=Escallonia rubra TaxID=112253 RepID=A0AA88S8H2_9ASTE|nr:hypothetical protein RJ640_010209 [Escallonia rubra]
MDNETHNASQLLSPHSARNLFDSVDAFLFDCDGVIWKGDSLIDGVPETLDMLRSKGKKLVFVTNNSTKSRRQYANKFRSLGITVTEDEIFSSSFAAAMFLKVNGFPREKKVYVLGEEGILEELELAGFTGIGGPFTFFHIVRLSCLLIGLRLSSISSLVFQSGRSVFSFLLIIGRCIQMPFEHFMDGNNIYMQEDGTKTVQLKPNSLFEHDKSVGAVVVGLDQYVNYYKLQYGTLCIRENPGCLFIATNRDAVGHMTDLQEWPGAGCMVAAICGSTQKEPIVVGKPSTFMMDFLLQKFHISTSRMCMVGDRLDTDILFGQNAGCKTLLVFSGVTTQSTLEDPSNDIRPDYYTSKVSDVLNLLEF